MVQSAAEVIERGVVTLEVPRDARNRDVQRVLHSIGPTAKILKGLASARQLRTEC